MEFSEKLQQLRKQHQLTQEQLAEKLYVSRTAVSKWESGRGYPNLSSLKDIAGLFQISLDDLLSNEELLDAAKAENQRNLGKLSGSIFAGIDCISILLLFLPLFGQREQDFIRAVSIWRYTEAEPIQWLGFLAALLM